MTPNTPTPAATAPAGQVHTATRCHFVPRQICEDGSVYPASIETEDGNVLCYVESSGVADLAVKNPNSIWSEGHEERAAHIVHCVNTHSQLLAQNAALRDALLIARRYVAMSGDHESALAMNAVDHALSLVAP